MKTSLGSIIFNNCKTNLSCSLGTKNLKLSDNENFNTGEVILQGKLNQCRLLLKDLKKENEILKKGLVPYKRKNEKLLIENNKLQSKLSKQKEEYHRELTKLKRKNKEARSDLTNLEIINSHTVEKIKQLERELFEKNKKILSLAADRSVVLNSGGNGELVSPQFPALEITGALMIDYEKLQGKLWESKAQLNDVKVFNMVKAMEKHSEELMEELEDLRNDNHHLYEMITALKCQVDQKDREIDRLHHSLEERSFSTMTHDCCSQCKQKGCKIKSLEEQLEAAVLKQHEAMGRALHLAERNQLLERELKDIDKVALAVEEECQKKLKQTFKNMDVLQDKLQQKIQEIKKLEQVLEGMRTKIESDEHTLKNLGAEKKLLEKNLNLAALEKKNLNDKINQFVVSEKNLTIELSRLQETNRSLMRQLGDMEKRVEEVLGTNKRSSSGKQKGHTLGFLSSTNSTTSSNLKFFGEEMMSCIENHNFDSCGHIRGSSYLLEKVQEERNYYRSECCRLKELLESLLQHSENSPELIRHLQDQEREIRELKQETLKHALFKGFESGDHFSCASGDSIKSIMDKLEKERDLALSNVSRLQSERDALKDKVKLTMESQMLEQSRLGKIVMESEERIRRLESERRELMSNHTSQRVALTSMEEKCDKLREEAKNAKADLAQMTANYIQLKTLQEQTDRSLSDVQHHLDEVSRDLKFETNRIKELEKEKADLEKDICILRNEKSTMKSSLTFIEKEKDSLLIILDEKTERLAKLENQIKKQESYISELTEKLSHFQRKFEVTLNEKTSHDQALRSLERVVENQKEELEQCERQKEAFVRENRRLQDDLASAAKDCFATKRDLDCEKQEVENLKRQLQQYVSEVKRAEELLSKKETERNQMLDHFRSLSLEATALESNNHTLESTVENTKTQLLSAGNRITDLEHQIASKESLLYNYEKQIAELTTQVAELESKLKEETERRIRAEEDLSALRELCSTIDGQKEALRRHANSYDAEKTQLMNEVRRLSEEYEGLSQKLSHEQSLSQCLEKSLSNSRQETLEHKITNKDLRSHVQQLKQKVDELTRKLESECEDVRRYQGQCADLSQQVSELRREVTNARFERAKAAEDSRRNVDTEEAKEFWFEGEFDGSSSRNIPPLTFPEDSDRTFSLDLEAVFPKSHLDESGRTFKKFDWNLSPLVEGKSPCEDHGSSKETSADSELSSLPDDGELENGSTKMILSDSEGGLADFSLHPTYSVRGRPDAGVREKSDGTEGGSWSRGMESDPGRDFFFWKEQASLAVESCSEREFQNGLARAERGKSEARVALAMSPLQPASLSAGGAKGSREA